MQNTILSYLSGRLNNIIKNLDKNFFEKIEEIRIRVNKPIILYSENKEYTVNINGYLSNDLKLGYKVVEEDLNKTIEKMSNFSLYSLENELKNGYITLQGGHRVGISGKVVIENRKVKTITNISGLNIRIAHEVYGCSNKIIDYIIKDGVKHTMIISPPLCGKTTLLRDIIRQISNGVDGVLEGQTVGVVDERSEIAGCYNGIPQNNIGLRTDVLDCCPKSDGMIMLLRSMSPKVIAVDEIGGKDDIFAIDEIINAGVKVICTVNYIYKK